MSEGAPALAAMGEWSVELELAGAVDRFVCKCEGKAPFSSYSLIKNLEELVGKRILSFLLIIWHQIIYWIF